MLSSKSYHHQHLQDSRDILEEGAERFEEPRVTAIYSKTVFVGQDRAHMNSQWLGLQG